MEKPSKSPQSEENSLLFYFLLGMASLPPVVVGTVLTKAVYDHNPNLFKAEVAITGIASLVVWFLIRRLADNNQSPSDPD